MYQICHPPRDASATVAAGIVVILRKNELRSGAASFVVAAALHHDGGFERVAVRTPTRAGVHVYVSHGTPYFDRYKNIGEP